MKTLVVANWKMNPATFRDARMLFDATKKAAEKTKGASVVVAPPAIYLHTLAKSYRGKALRFALQHGHFERTGAHTGETSFAQAKDAGAAYAIIGHAERRVLGETDSVVRAQVAAALALNMTPILCVGETVRAQGGEHFAVIKEQLRIGLADVPETKLGNIVIAYEPVWAIGAPLPMSARDMQEMAIFIRKVVVEGKGQGGHAVSIIYGGAVDETNARALLECGDVRGFLVGRASADAQRFAALLLALV